MRIVYCTKNVSHVGGVPNVLAIKANALAECYNHDVYIVESDHREFVPESAVFSPAVRFIDLDIHYDRLPKIDHWNPFGDYCRAKRRHKRRLKAVLKEICPDVVVSLGEEDKFFLASIRGCWKKVREFHWTTNIREVLYGHLSTKNHIIAKLADFIDYRLFLQRFDRIVLLSEQEKRLYWNRNKKFCVIPNPQTFRSDRVSSLKNKKLISVGRLQFQKNYDSLIRAFAIVNREFPDWSLDIYGDGPDRVRLQCQIDRLGLTGKVELKGNTKHIREALLDASCFVLSSRWEGMPLVMIEAMTCGLPLISYNCPSGPEDLITDDENGYLIPVGNEAEFATKIMDLIRNDGLRMELGAGSRRASERYAPEKIMAVWHTFFEELCH